MLFNGLEKQIQSYSIIVGGKTNKKHKKLTNRKLRKTTHKISQTEVGALKR